MFILISFFFYSWFLESAEVYSPFIMVQLISIANAQAVAVFHIDLVQII